MLYRILADLVLVLHLGFIVFAVAGGFLVLRWPRGAWLHLPAVAWAARIELKGGVCPLTPLENWLRRRAGGPGYEGGFIEHYLTPLVYPEGLSRADERWLGLLVIAWNLLLYGWLLARRRRHRQRGGAV